MVIYVYQYICPRCQKLQHPKSFVIAGCRAIMCADCTRDDNQNCELCMDKHASYSSLQQLEERIVIDYPEKNALTEHLSQLEEKNKILNGQIADLNAQLENQKQVVTALLDDITFRSREAEKRNAEIAPVSNENASYEPEPVSTKSALVSTEPASVSTEAVASIETAPMESSQGPKAFQELKVAAQGSGRLQKLQLDLQQLEDDWLAINQSIIDKC